MSLGYIISFPLGSPLPFTTTCNMETVFVVAERSKMDVLAAVRRLIKLSEKDAGKANLTIWCSILLIH